MEILIVDVREIKKDRQVVQNQKRTMKHIDDLLLSRAGTCTTPGLDLKTLSIERERQGAFQIPTTVDIVTYVIVDVHTIVVVIVVTIRTIRGD